MNRELGRHRGGGVFERCPFIHKEPFDMFFKFWVISSKKTNVSSLMRRLGSCLPSRVVRLGAAMVAAALLPAIASAMPTLPDPIYEIVLEENASRRKFSSPGSLTLGNLSATVAGSPEAVVVGKAIGGADISNSANASVFYSYVVDGPLAGVFVPLFVSVDLFAATSGPVTGGAVAVALFRVTEAQSFIAIGLSANASNNDPSLVGEVSGTFPFNEISGRVGTIELAVSVSTHVDPGGFAQASVDPFIFIDPGFLSSHPGYSVVVSPGIGNLAPAPPVPGVPEPATLVLLASGVLGLVALRRRRL
jgi:PEP-CTERM motif